MTAYLSSPMRTMFQGFSMSSTIKRHNHRIHPCNTSRKNELLEHLIAQHSGSDILIITAGDPERITFTAGTNITILSDTALAQSGELKCDILISYDLPEKAIVYMSRFARAREHALVLLDAEDQKFLYGIETLLGRTIIQESISGFEPDFGIAAEQKSKEVAKARRAEREERNAKRDERPKRDFKPRSSTDRSGGKREERDFRDDKRPPRKPSASEDQKSDYRGGKGGKPRFLGKDENGKPIFDGKTRDRNHYIDGTPRTDAEKAYKTPYSSKPKFFGKDQKSSDERKPAEGKKESFRGDKKPSGDKKSYGEKKPYGDKKPFGDKKSYGDKKPIGDKKTSDDQKSHGKKKPYGDKKPFDDKKGYGDKKPYDAKKSSDAPSEPKRPPRRINVKSFKPSEKKQ